LWSSLLQKKVGFESHILVGDSAFTQPHRLRLRHWHFRGLFGWTFSSFSFVAFGILNIGEFGHSSKNGTTKKRGAKSKQITRPFAQPREMALYSEFALESAKKI
jgi:hypothetical protein